MDSLRIFFERDGYFSNTTWDDMKTTVDDRDGNSYNMPLKTFNLPSQTAEGIISRIDYNIDPIVVYISDKAKGKIIATWKMTKKQWDNSVAIAREPKINARVRIEFLRDGKVNSIQMY